MAGLKTAGLLLLAGVLGPAHAATTILLDSDPGDYIGLGAKAVFAAPTWTLTHTANQSLVRLEMNDGDQYWSLEFEVPRGATLAQPGQHPGAIRWPFNPATVPGLSVSGDGRGCNTVEGWFEVLEGAFTDAGELLTLAIDFKQNCSGATSALYGSIRIDSAIPLEVPGPRSVGGRDRAVYGLDAVVLDGRHSHDRDRDALTYAWTQVAGPPVELRGAATALADFTAPLAPPGGDDYLFQLEVSDPDGNTDTDTVAVEVRSMSDPQSYVLFRSDSGDYIGQGRTVRMMPDEGDLVASLQGAGVTIGYFAESGYHLDFAPRTGQPLAPGAYEDARRFADATHPGIDIGGDGRGCNSITGRFDVLQVLLAGDDVVRFGVDFEQHCEGNLPALRGEARYNYIPTGLPVARAGADRTVEPGASVGLDGGESSDDAGITTYRWRQLAGPTVTLSGADTATPGFTAPDGFGTLEFQLLVADAKGHTAVDSVSVQEPRSSGSGAMPGALLLLALLGRWSRRRGSR